VDAVADDLARLEAEARYQRERYDLYKAKAYGSRPTSGTRMRELERLWKSAEARLTEARARADRD
jgi:hypothetical protein